MTTQMHAKSVVWGGMRPRAWHRNCFDHGSFVNPLLIGLFAIGCLQVRLWSGPDVEVESGGDVVDRIAEGMLGVDKHSPTPEISGLEERVPPRS